MKIKIVCLKYLQILKSFVLNLNILPRNIYDMYVPQL